MKGFSFNGSTARLASSATRHGARVPSIPVADYAILSARLGATSFGQRKIRTDVATVAGVLGDAASLRVGTAATGLSAGREARPRCGGAVNRAFAKAASFGLLRFATCNTTISRLGFNEALPAPAASAASERARVPNRPHRHDTVSRAADTRSTFCRFAKVVRTALAAKGGCAIDRMVASLGTDTAADAAGRPRFVMLYAIDRAIPGVASFGFLASLADLASVLKLASNSAGPGPGATATSDGALLPVRPLTHCAINSASVGFALLSLCERRTNLATVVVIDFDAPGLATLATATALGALCPIAKVGHDTVNGTFMSLALFDTFHVSAVFSAMFSRADNGTGLRVATAAAGDTAGTPCTSPRASNAVDRAGWAIAGFDFVRERADRSAVLVLLKYRPGASLGASATSSCSGTSAPILPCTNGAVYYARAEVAVLGVRALGGCFPMAVHVRSCTRRTAELSWSRYVAGTGLLALAT